MKKLFFLFVLLLLTILPVKAEPDPDCMVPIVITKTCTGSLLKLNPNDVINCEISFKTNEDETCEPTKETLKTISFRHLYSSDMTISAEVNGPGFTRTKTGDTLSFSRTNGLNEGILYSYNLKMPSVISEDKNYSITVTDVDIKNNEDKPVAVFQFGDTLSLKVIKPKSKIDTLSELKVSSFNLTPVFPSDTLDYSLTVDTNVSEVTISAVATDSYATVTGDIGKKALTFGDNTFYIKVKAENGNIKTYTIIVKRLDKRSNENGLKTLTVSNIYFDFKVDQYRYDLEADKDITTVKINSTLIDSKASYVDGFGNDTKTLVIGNNTFYIKVKAEDDTVKTYTINIVKNDGKSTVNTLQSLSVVGYKNIIKFVPETFTYSMSVSSQVDQIEIDSKLMSTKSSYVSGYGNRKVKLNVGVNKVEIKIKSEKGDVKTYAINVTREDPKENTYLKSIEIEDVYIKFDKDTFEYKFEIPFKINKLKLKTVTEEKNSTVTVTGNEKLSVGENTVIIEVVSESGKKKEYKLIATKRDKPSTVSKLKKITIKNHNINFQSDVYEYVVQIDDEKNLDINIEKLDSLTLYSIVGNNNLKSGSKVVINSYAEDGTKTVYTINITKELKFIYPLIGLSIMTFIIIMTLKRKKKVRVIDKKVIQKENTNNSDKVVRFNNKIKAEGIPEIDHSKEEIEEEDNDIIDDDFMEEEIKKEPKFIKQEEEPVLEVPEVQEENIEPIEEKVEEKEDEVLEL